MAVGWYSGRVDETQPQAARHRHHRHHRSQSVNLHSQRHHPDRSRPTPHPQGRPTTMRELQQQMLQCLYNHPSPEGQAACLQAVLRELGASPNIWGGPGSGGPTLPFALLGQD